MLMRIGSGVLFAASFALAAQFHGGDGTLLGQISPLGALSPGTVVEISGQERSPSPLRVYPDGAGEFRFNGLTPGDYELRVTNHSGVVLYTAPVAVLEGTTQISVRVPAGSGGPAGTVPVTALRHKPPAPARTAFGRAEREIDRGNYSQALPYLETAVSADPGYAEAYINLAACEGYLKHYDKALTHARRSVELAPGMAAAQVNLSQLLLYSGRYTEAESAAREAVRRENSDKASYLLGLSLEGQNRDQEAVPYLTRAARSVPAARLHAARVLATTGKPRQAAQELRTYLASAKAQERPALESWLARLEK